MGHSGAYWVVHRAADWMDDMTKEQEKHDLRLLITIVIAVLVLAVVVVTTWLMTGELPI